MERPTPANPRVSWQMARMPRKDTKPEIALRRVLHARGLRFRVHARLPGTPDIVFTRAKIVVFLDGCFWHGCPEHGSLPKSNREWWQRKLDDNRERDARKDGELRRAGYEIFHFWEHEDPSRAADQIETSWRRRRQRVTPAPPSRV